MKSIQIKNIFKIILLTLSCVILVPAFVACDDDNDVKEPTDPYANLHMRGIDEAGLPADVPLGEDYALDLGNGASGSYEFSVRTNINSWTINAKGEGDLSWVNIWPGTGEGDGRFYFKLSRNLTFEERSAEVVITASDGKEVHLFDVKQAAGVRAIVLSGIKTINAQATQMAIKVETNVGSWDVVKYPDDITIEKVDQENGVIVYHVPANDDPKAKEREFTIEVESTDDDTAVVKEKFTLKQNP